jgi:hypothetical protein
MQHTCKIVLISFCRLFINDDICEIIYQQKEIFLISLVNWSIVIFGFYVIGQIIYDMKEEFHHRSSLNDFKNSVIKNSKSNSHF